MRCYRRKVISSSQFTPASYHRLCLTSVCCVCCQHNTPRLLHVFTLHFYRQQWSRSYTFTTSLPSSTSCWKLQFKAWYIIYFSLTKQMVPNCDILLLFIHCCLLYEPVQRAAFGSKSHGSCGALTYQTLAYSAREALLSAPLSKELS